MYSVVDITEQKEYNFAFFEDAEKFFREYRQENSGHIIQVKKGDRVIIRFCNEDD